MPSEERGLPAEAWLEHLQRVAWLSWDGIRLRVLADSSATGTGGSDDPVAGNMHLRENLQSIHGFSSSRKGVAC